MMTENEKMLTTMQVAVMLGTSTKTVLRAVKRKGMKPARLKRQYRFTPAMAAALVADDAVIEAPAPSAPDTPEK